MTLTWLGLFLLGDISVFTCSLFLFFCLLICFFAAVLALLQPPSWLLQPPCLSLCTLGVDGEAVGSPSPHTVQPPPECRPPPASLHPPLLPQRTAYVCRLLMHNFSVFLFYSSVLHLHPCRYCSFVLSPHHRHLEPPPPPAQPACALYICLTSDPRSRLRQIHILKRHEGRFINHRKKKKKNSDSEKLQTLMLPMNRACLPARSLTSFTHCVVLVRLWVLVSSRLVHFLCCFLWCSVNLSISLPANVFISFFVVFFSRFRRCFHLHLCVSETAGWCDS